MSRPRMPLASLPVVIVLVTTDSSYRAPLTIVVRYLTKTIKQAQRQTLT